MRARKILAVAAFPSLLAAAVALVVVFRGELWELFATTERLRERIASAGATAPLVFVGVQALQVVVFFIPGEIPQVVGGYLFGLRDGTLLSLAGIAAGSLVSFSIARVFGVPFVHALFDRDRVDRLRRILESPRAKLSFFLLFLIPGLPKDILCYAAGLSSIRLLVFLPFSAVGRLPGIIGSALMGQAVASRRWFLAATVLTLAVVLFVIGYLFRERIQLFLEKLTKR
ncbi:MAG: TVP38/TMEM64 family protein [Spirochaetales bacterium]|nr:TVP38/TMEM64 family protein [Spirochaetales bacterium]